MKTRIAVLHPCLLLISYILQMIIPCALPHVGKLVIYALKCWSLLQADKLTPYLGKSLANHVSLEFLKLQYNNLKGDCLLEVSRPPIY